MPRRTRSGKLFTWGIPCAAFLILGAAVQASGPGLGHPFCTVNKRCQEKPPHWHIKRTCPKPVCDPCFLEHHGYYHTCWRPSSVPPDWSHCPVPPPAVAFLATQAPPPAGGLMPVPPPQVPRPGEHLLPESGTPLPSPAKPSKAGTPPSSAAPVSNPTTAVTPPPSFAVPPSKPAAPSARQAGAYLPASR